MSELKPLPLADAIRIVDPDSGERARDEITQDAVDRFLQACRIVCAAARRARPDNAPLTLAELKTRNKPVWVSVPNASWIPDGGYYALCQNGYITPPTERSFTVEFCVTNGWVFYDRKPEPEGGGR